MHVIKFPAVSRNGDKGRCLICLLSIIHWVGGTLPLTPDHTSLYLVTALFPDVPWSARAHGCDCWVDLSFPLCSLIWELSQIQPTYKKRIQGKHLPTSDLWSDDLWSDDLWSDGQECFQGFFHGVLSLSCLIPVFASWWIYGDIQMRSHLLLDRALSVIKPKNQKR